MVTDEEKLQISSMKANVHNTLCTCVQYCTRRTAGFRRERLRLWERKLYFKSNKASLWFFIVLSQLSGLSLSTKRTPFTQMGGKSRPIVRLSITAESLHLSCKTKQKRLQGVYAQMPKGTQISDNAPCRQRDRNDTRLTFTHTVLVKYKRNKHGTLGDVLFAFLPECEHDYACLCIHVYRCSQEAASVQPATCAMLLPLKGVNYSGLFLAWDIILSLYWAENNTGPLKALLSDIWEAGVHI